MAQIIAKFGYLKGKSRGGYAKYIATREGVEKLDESLRDRPVTQSQQEFINKLLEDFPDSKELWEYEDYKKSPTLGSASEFISLRSSRTPHGRTFGKVGLPQVHGNTPTGGKAGQPWAVLPRRGTDFSRQGGPGSGRSPGEYLDSHLLPAPGGRPAAGL